MGPAFLHGKRLVRGWGKDVGKYGHSTWRAREKRIGTAGDVRNTRRPKKGRRVAW